MDVVPGGTILSAGNLGTTDILSNGGAGGRNFAAGHSTLANYPTAGLLATLSASSNVRGGTVLITT
jgi:hypothetical protein